MRYVVAVVTLLVVMLFIACAQSLSCPNGTSFQDKPCLQACNNTNCSMSCSSITGMCMNCSSSGQCIQTCSKDCGFVTCESENCTTRLCQGSCKTITCDSDAACALECADGTELCRQTCNGTSCASLVSKASRVEMQFCYGNCDSMQCNSRNCTQKCGGTCPKMTCNGDSCDQECSGESCEMHCPKSVKSCTHTCKRGKCKLLCEAENCKKNCTESAECSKIQLKSSGALFRWDLTLLVNGVFLVILAVLLQ